MKTNYHRQITQQAVGSQVSQRVLDVFIAANIGQDALRFQVGHDHFHYDSNAFTAGDAYVESQQALIQPALTRGDPQAAWRAFGRLSHAVQDLYAHSNYAALWLAKKNGVNLTPKQIDALDVDILSSPNLRSGKPDIFDLLQYLNVLPESWLKLAPKDSHIKLNIDGPDRAYFEFVFSAAVKRTQFEFSRVLNSLTTDLVKAFTDI
jgi:hypothetical protein